MTAWLDEKVPRVKPLSVARIEIIADAVLQVISPKTLEEPLPLDVRELVDFGLPKLGIHIQPGDASELRGMEACTDVQVEGEINILIQQDQWDDLFLGGPAARRPRSTIIHEVGHAVLHVPQLRQELRRQLHEPGLVLARSARRELKAYEDPEWQAWAIAGCLLAPRRTIEMQPGRTIDQLADTYQMSKAMMDKHLKRLKIPLAFK